MFSTNSSSLSKDEQFNQSKTNKYCETGVPTQLKVEVPVWFSVFIGDPDSTAPRFQHARFDAKVSKDMFAFEQPGIISYNHSIENSRTANTREKQKFCAIVSLSLAFADEMMNCVERRCIVCKLRPAESLVHRPLCAIENGYNELADFRETYKLMSTITSHTESITRTDEMNWSIGGFISDRPYVCALAIPICSDQGECHRVATERTQKYIEDIIDGVILRQSLADAKAVRFAGDKKSETLESSTQSSDSIIINRSVESGLDSLFSKGPESPLKEGSYIIGTTMFVGRPNLQAKGSPPQGELSCFVLSTTFPRSAMPDSSKNQADAAIDYCRISGYYERDLLHNVDLRCAVCPKAIAASTLVHLPVAFPRTHRYHLEDGPTRRLIMKLCRFVNSTWNYPEMNAALGFGSDAHIFEFMVPICATKSICEDVARTSAREFLRLLTPSGVSLPFPGLDPDSNLAAVHAVFRSFSEEESQPAESLVEKISPECLMSENEENADNAKERTLSVNSLRLWFEKCYADTEVKSEPSANLENKEEEQKKASNEEGETENSVVWVFDLVDHSHSLDGDEGSVEAESPDPVIEETRNQEMFQPILTMGFWLLYETVGSRDTDEADLSDDHDEQYFSGHSSYEDEGHESEGEDFSSD